MQIADILGILGFLLSLVHLVWEIKKQKIKIVLDSCVVHFVIGDMDFGYLFTFSCANKTARNLPILSFALKLSDDEIWPCRQSTREDVKDIHESKKLPISVSETWLPIDIAPYSSRRISLLFRSQKTTNGSENLNYLLFDKGKDKDICENAVKTDIKQLGKDRDKYPEVTVLIKTPWKVKSVPVKIIEAKKSY